MADRTLLESRWDEMQGRVKEAWGALTDDDVARLQGRWDQLVATIERKTGEAVDAIEGRLDELLAELQDDREDASGTDAR